LYGHLFGGKNPVKHCLKAIKKAAQGGAQLRLGTFMYIVDIRAVIKVHLGRIRLIFGREGYKKCTQNAPKINLTGQIVF
jgi:hypothetical protein